jgi:hypothetical protein
MKESSQIRPSVGRIPFLWRKRITNLINQDPEKAIEIFFTKYLIGKESKQMKYGLENTLPDSLKYIVSKFDSLDKTDLERTIELLETPKFTDSLLILSKDDQEKILSKLLFYLSQNNVTRVKNILGQFDPSLSIGIFDSIGEEYKAKSFLLSLWTEVDIRVYYILLEKYLLNPNDLVLSVFKHSSTQKLLTACLTHNYPLSLHPYSEIRLKAFLKLFGTSKEELGFLLTSFSNLPKIKHDILIEWLNTNSISLTNLLNSIPSENETKIVNLIISYATNNIFTTKHEEFEILLEFVKSYHFALASTFLAKIDFKSDKKGITLLFHILSNFNQDLTPFQDFFSHEFQKYGYQNFQEIVTAFFTSKNNQEEEIYLSFLQSGEKKNWKPILTQIIQGKLYIKKEKVTKLLFPFNSNTKPKITRFLVKKSQLNNFLYLFTDFDPY